MWSELLSGFWTWAVYAFVGSLGTLNPMSTRALWSLVERWLDRHYADDLPESTGAFTRRCAARQWGDRAPEVLYLPEDHALTKEHRGFTGAYYAPYVLLTRKTFFKCDPSYWAVGAHELGHALMHRRVAWLWNAAAVLRALTPQVSTLALTLLLSNIVLGSMTVMNVALWLYWSIVAMGLVGCMDELGASVIAIRLLKEDGRLRRGHWLGVYGTLGTALLTYVGSVAGSLTTVLLYDDLATASLSDTPFALAPALAGSQLTVCVGLSIVLLGVGLYKVLDRTTGQVVEDFETPHTEWDRTQSRRAMGVVVSETLTGVLETVGVVCLIWWTWDQSAEAVWLVCVATAVHRLHRVYGLLLRPPTYVLTSIIAASLMPVFLTVNWYRSRLDRALASDPRQREPAEGDIAREAEHTQEHASPLEAVESEWKKEWFKSSWRRVPDLVHLPMCAYFLFMVGSP